MCFIYNILHGKYPEYLSDSITMAHEVHTYGTRNRNKMYVTIAKSDAAKRSLFFDGIREYNNLPENIVNSESIFIFRRKFILYLKNEL